jgi:hypothetical protein
LGGGGEGRATSTWGKWGAGRRKQQGKREGDIVKEDEKRNYKREK